jgi:hypothetical protein
MPQVLPHRPIILGLLVISIRACHQINHMTEAARWMAARKLRAVLS